TEVKSGVPEVAAPVYSHVAYDIVPGEYQIVRQPDILIIEGLNVLQPGPSLTVSDLFDFSIYVDAHTEHIEQWYINRFLTLRNTAFTNPNSHFHHFAQLSDEDAIAEAQHLWKTINEPNLVENILPTRPRATLVLRKDVDHSINRVRLRKLWTRGSPGGPPAQPAGQQQLQVRVEPLGRFLEIDTGQFTAAANPVAQRVRVDVQPIAGHPDVPERLQVGQQGAGQFGAVLGVVLEEDGQPAVLQPRVAGQDGHQFAELRLGPDVRDGRHVDVQVVAHRVQDPVGLRAGIGDLLQARHHGTDPRLHPHPQVVPRG